MIYNMLGKTEIEVSPLTIGAWQLGGPLAFDGIPDGHPDPGKKNVLAMIHTLEERGINAIDTAEQYSNGESERRVGEALKDRRERWIVSTKFGYRVSDNLQRIDDSSPSTIRSSLEGSLKRLATDYIDIYLYHCAPALENLDAARAILEQAKEAGKIRHYGISTQDFDLVRKLAETEMCEVLQYPANILDPQKELRTYANEHRIGLQLRGVMAAGRLSGKYFRKAPEFKPDDGRSTSFKNDNFQRYAALQEHAPEGYSMAQTAIRWGLDQLGNATICLGAKSLSDYESALQAVELPPLTSQQCAALEIAAKNL